MHRIKTRAINQYNKILDCSIWGLMAPKALSDCAAKQQARLLCVACQDGDVEEVERQLAGINNECRSRIINLAIDDSGYNAIYACLKSDKLEPILKLLVAHGADVNMLNKVGYTPLQTAIVIYNGDVAEAVLDVFATSVLTPTSTTSLSRFDVNAPGKDGITAMRLALTMKRYNKVFVEKLLALGATFEPVWLLHVVGDGRLPLVKLLLASPDVNVNVRCPANGFTALHIVSKHGHVAVAAHLLCIDDIEVDPCDKVMQRTPLFVAASSGHAVIVRMLLERGADVDGKDSIPSTPVFAAASQGHAEVVRVLIDAGADLNAAAIGLTPLEVARSRSHTEVVKVLLDTDGRINLSNLSEETTGSNDDIEEMLSNAVLKRVCLGCATLFRNTLMKCSGCRVCRYCSAGCQKAHWTAVHRKHCAKVARARREGRDVQKGQN